MERELNPLAFCLPAQFGDFSRALIVPLFPFSTTLFSATLDKEAFCSRNKHLPGLHARDALPFLPEKAHSGPCLPCVGTPEHGDFCSGTGGLALVPLSGLGWAKGA
jgi:hypothetical protein